MEPNEELIRLQKTLGWTNPKTARQLDVSLATIGKWRAGCPQPGPLPLMLMRQWAADAADQGIKNPTPVWAGDHWEYIDQQGKQHG